MMRLEGRAASQLRSVRITPGFISQAEGSALIEVGHTRVICTATVEETVPVFLKGTNKGWITSEYSMLPRATNIRTPRESTAGKKSGRTHEIQRLIGRALRASIELEKLGERQIWIDCDVIEADGGIRRETVPLLKAAGADYIVPGSLMFKENPSEMRAWLDSL